jgi:hypothetical protein
LQFSVVLPTYSKKNKKITQQSKKKASLGIVEDTIASPSIKTHIKHFSLIHHENIIFGFSLPYQHHDILFLKKQLRGRQQP